MTTYKHRVPAATMVPTKNTTTFDNFGQIQRLTLRSTDANARFAFAISDVKTNDVFTNLSLFSAMLDNTGTFQIHATLFQSDEVGVLEMVATVSSTATGGIAKLDTFNIPATPGMNFVSPKVNLNLYTYVIVLTLSNSSPTPDISQVVVPWVEYSFKR